MQVLDFLWSWAETKGDWAKILVVRLSKKGKPLPEGERNAIYEYFLARHKMAETDVPALEKPTTAVAEKDLSLISLANVRGVNRLSETKTLTFHPRLTVVYGGNGTGKTGYVRVLKAIGRSYADPDRILPDIFEAPATTVDQSATIAYKEGQHKQEFVWKGEVPGNCEALRRVSVFSERCAQISLLSTRQLLVTPAGFHLFPLLSSELNALKAINRAKIDELRSGCPDHRMLHNSTTVHQYMTELSEGSVPPLPEGVIGFDHTHSQELDALRQQLAGLSENNIRRQLAQASSHRDAVESTLQRLTQAAPTLASAFWEVYNESVEEFTQLRRKQTAGVAAIAATKNVKLLRSPEFQEFIHAADRYIQLLIRHDEKQEACPYCLRDFDYSVRELVESYQKALRGHDAEMRARTEEHLNALRSRALDVDAAIEFAPEIEDDPTLLSHDDRRVLQSWNTQLESLKTFLRQHPNATIPQKTTELDLEGVRAILVDIARRLTEREKCYQAALSNIEVHRSTLTRDIHELEDRQWLAEHLDDVNMFIGRLQRADQLARLNRDLATNSVTKKAKEAREALLTTDFKAAFHDELRALRKDDLTVRLKFETTRGETKLNQHVTENHGIAEVLSEGEQKAIALAELMAELTLDSAASPVVFDDPVTSMDHEVIEYVAQRLVAISKTRQIIVFTHSILLLSCIVESNGSRKDVSYYEISKSSLGSGILEENFVATLSVREYLAKLDRHLTRSREPWHSPVEMTIQGYRELRQALEVFLETKLFGETVRRYRRNVIFGRLGRIQGAKIDQHKEEILAMHSRCSRWLHSNPTEFSTPPTLEDLERDVTRFKHLCAEFD